MVKHPASTPSSPPRSPRGRKPYPPASNAAVKGFSDIRLCPATAETALQAAADRLSLPRSNWTSERFDMLALSGGAAGGAFGAGALCGWSQSGTRPQFAFVTGVSTGALIAPLAFLGRDWDDKLRDAYTGGHARSLLDPRRLAPVLSGGLLRGEALEALITPFVDHDLIKAIAREHARGRRLLVATTDLDSQSACIWDMGAIATHGGDAALKLFRDILIASASLPVVFAPRLIDVEIDGQTYQEMHVDGGLASPLFLMPETMMRWQKLGRRLKGGRVHVIVNTVLDPAPRTTAPNMATITVRSFEAMLRFSYRQALNTAVTFCAARGLPLRIASIPCLPEGTNLMNFDTPAMQSLFETGQSMALDGSLWTTAVPSQGFERIRDALNPR
ncbi:patatin-like phospholipase family protein [Brevundimonas sp.]|uniref:patatin-like phospholipase family protein n=1 Tax=Brevundimonas sp. TaxID=1871086 RepID=UPI002FCA9347